MTKDLIRKYIWLVDTVNMAGSRGISYQDISDKWEQNTELSGGNKYSWRTFMNNRKDVFEIFGVEIACNHGDNTYYIADRNELKEASGFKAWILDALSLSNQLNESMALQHRILLEENPSGKELLPDILEAMRENKMLTFTYKPFWVEKEEGSNLFHVEPYAVKVFKRRWYLLGKYGDSPLKIYALDRISNLDIEFEDFVMPDDFDAEAFFSNCFGIIVGDKEAQTVKLKVGSFQAKYLHTLPLHHSQKVLERNDKYTVFSYFVRPTFDFKQELLSLGDTIEVMEPLSLRRDIARIGKEMSRKNGENPSDHRCQRK